MQTYIPNTYVLLAVLPDVTWVEFYFSTDSSTKITQRQ